MPRRAVEKAVEQAEILQPPTWNGVERAIERAGPRRAYRILPVLEELEGLTTMKELEEAASAPSREAAVPTPEVNAWSYFRRRQRDWARTFFWRWEQLVVETDGHPFTAPGSPGARYETGRAGTAGWLRAHSLHRRHGEKRGDPHAARRYVQAPMATDPAELGAGA